MYHYKIKALLQMSILLFFILFSKLMTDIFNPFNDWTSEDK